MPIINTWVPSAFVVLLTVLTMFTLLAFDRKTRGVVMHVVAVVIGMFFCYQLYCNIEAGVDFMTRYRHCRYRRLREGHHVRTSEDGARAKREPPDLRNSSSTDC